MNSKIIKAVNKILEEQQINEVPIPVERVSENLGARLVYQQFEGKGNISGILYTDDENTIIGINSTNSKNRQRFSIAHEIGHLLLHQQKKSLFVDKTLRVKFRDKKSNLAVDKDEIAANAFAEELLMPKNFIMKEVEKYVKDKEEDSIDIQKFIDHMTKKFQVSPLAMGYRLINIGVLSF